MRNTKILLLVLCLLALTFQTACGGGGGGGGATSTATGNATPPQEISEISLNGSTLYTYAGGIQAAPTITAARPAFSVKFNSAISVAQDAVMTLKVDESDGIISTSKYIQFGGTLSNGYINWSDVFDTIPTSGITTFNFQIKVGSTYNLSANKTYTVTLTTLTGFSNSSNIISLTAPVSGQFKTDTTLN